MCPNKDWTCYPEHPQSEHHRWYLSQPAHMRYVASSSWNIRRICWLKNSSSVRWSPPMLKIVWRCSLQKPFLLFLCLMCWGIALHIVHTWLSTRRNCKYALEANKCYYLFPDSWLMFIILCYNCYGSWLRDSEQTHMHMWKHKRKVVPHSRI